MPGKQERITMTLQPKVAKGLKRLAKKKDMSVSTYVHKLIKKYLKFKGRK